MFDPASIVFIWPAMLWLLLAVPLLAVGYIWLGARRSRAAARYAVLVEAGALDGAGAPPQQGHRTKWSLRRAAFKRHLPPLLIFIALCALLLAVARPQASLMLPVRAETVILAIDASGSMRATDMSPDRITAAKNAAKEFVAHLPGHVRVGIVAFAGTASLAQSPTQNREDLYRAIDRFQLQRGTALGTGLIVALTTLLPGAGIDAAKFIDSGTVPEPRPGGDKSKFEGPGSYASAAIVLLTDGQSNTGPEPLKAAAIAAEHGVRVHSVGVGTPEGTVLKADGWSMHVRLDENTLKKIATLTRGEYYRASSAADLKQVYRQLGMRLALERMQPTEITAIVVAFGAACAMLSALLSLAWTSRIL